MFTTRWITLLSAALFVSCCGLPPLTLIEDQSIKIAPSGPSVAAVLANIKCELWEGANDDEHELPYYEDVLGLPLHPPSRHPSRDRAFTLKNLFSEIEYIAELKLTLETTDSGALNPSVNIIQPLKVANTNFTTAIGGQVFSSNDRIFDLYQSIDFQRLVRISPHPMFKHGFKVGTQSFTFDPEPPQATAPYNSEGLPDDWTPCAQGLGLHGRLGLREDLATSAIAARMQDVAVLLKTSGSSSTVYGQTPALSGFNGYAFGEMDTTINFTISLDLNVGPNWTFTTLKGPNVTGQGGGNGSGLVNTSRLSKDSLILTVIPVCIRPKYFPKQWLGLQPSGLQSSSGNSSPSSTGDLKGTVTGGEIGAQFKIKPDQAAKTQLPTLKFPIEYTPEMVFGTPIWANYLPSCASASGKTALAAAPAAAKTNLQLQGIDNLIRSQRRF
jgi:hypothetical protein